MKDAGQNGGKYCKIFDYGKEVMNIGMLLRDKRYLINPDEENEDIKLNGKKMANDFTLFTANAQANLKRYVKSDGIDYHDNTTYSTDEVKTFVNSSENKTKYTIKDETLELTLIYLNLPWICQKQS